MARLTRAVAAAALGLAAAVLLASCGGPREPRGILLVTIDTCRADRIGCYGAVHAATPTLDGLAEHGIRFDQAQAPAPMTLPSHASILTGLYPDRHGLRDNGTGPLPDAAVTLAEALAGKGWDTAAFLSAVPLDSTYGTGQGFRRYDDDFVQGDVHGDPLTHLHTDQRTAQQVVDVALPWLTAAARADRPFLGWVHFYDPHDPYTPPEGTVPPGGDAYDGEIAFVDRELARLLDALGPARARTIVCVTADHGESLGEHGEATHGFLLYQGTVRVPWVMTGPGVPRGVTVDDPVSLVQVTPTLLALAGVDAPPDLDGGSALDPAERGTTFSEALFPRLNFGWSGSRCIRDGHWKYIESPHPELFDLTADPGERTNLLESEPELAGRLRENLHRHFARGGALAVDAAGLDEAARERLEGLGYVGVGGGAAGPDEDLWDFSGGDPREMVGVFHDLQPLPTLVMSRRDDEARALVESLLARSPGNEALLRRVEQLYLRAGNWEDARDNCRRLLEVAPDDGAARRDLGSALLRLGDTAGAIAAYREAVQRHPDDALSQAALGIALASDGRCDEAEPALARAETLGLAPAAAASDVAGAWNDCGRTERALAAYDAALRADSAYAPAAQGKARVLDHAGRPREAADVLRAAVARSPGDADLLNNLAWMLADESIDPEEALRHAKRAAALAPDDASVLDTLGWAAIRAGRPADGLAALERAWKDTQDPEVRAHLGIALAETGDEEAGRAHVRAAVAERPGLAEVPEVAKWK